MIYYYCGVKHRSKVCKQRARLYYIIILFILIILHTVYGVDKYLICLF